MYSIQELEIVRLGVDGGRVIFKHSVPIKIDDFSKSWDWAQSRAGDEGKDWYYAYGKMWFMDESGLVNYLLYFK